MGFDWKDWAAYYAGWNEADAIEAEQRFRRRREQEEADLRAQREYEREVAQHEKRMRELDDRLARLDDRLESLLYEPIEDAGFSFIDDDEDEDYGIVYDEETDELIRVPLDLSYMDDDEDDVRGSLVEDDEDDCRAPENPDEDDESSSQALFVAGASSAPSEPSPLLTWTEKAGDSRESVNPLGKREKYRTYVAGIAEGNFAEAWRQASTEPDAAIDILLEPNCGKQGAIPAVYLNGEISGYTAPEHSDVFLSVLASGGTMAVTRYDVTVRPDKKRSGQERVYVWLTVQVEPPAKR